jgi:hypothetical protein
MRCRQSFAGRILSVLLWERLQPRSFFAQKSEPKASRLKPLPQSRSYILNTPKRPFSIGALKLADSASPSTRRVSAGSITPSSQSLAVA